MRTELVLTCPVCQKPLWVISLLITENDVNLVDKQRKAHTCSITSPSPDSDPGITREDIPSTDDGLFGL